MIPARLLTLVRSNVDAQFTAWASGRHEEADCDAPWSEWVDECFEWDQREGFTREFVSDLIGAGSRHRRLVDACTAEWFRYARSKEQVS